MTFTEKIILSGIISFALLRVIHENHKSIGARVPNWCLLSSTVIAFLTSIASIIWIWSQ